MLLLILIGEKRSLDMEVERIIDLHLVVSHMYVYMQDPKMLDNL